MVKTVRPFFCRIGSKLPIKDKIIPVIPPHKTYVELFVGGGAIYWNIPPDKYEGVKSVINDIDSELMEGYTILKNIKSRRFIGDFKNLREANAFYSMVHNTDNNRLIQLIHKWCSSFSATGRGKLYSIPSHINKLLDLDDYQERMKNTTILNQDYKKVINKYDSKDTFFFIDPPYEESNQLYSDSAMDYNELRDILKKIKGKFILTLNDSKNIRDIFSDFNISKIFIKIYLTDSKRIGGSRRNELLIKNY